MGRSMTKKLAKSVISQRRVLDVAAKIFRDYGYAGTTMRVIADEADLKAGSIYYHYKSKDELIGAVLDLGIQSVIESVNQAMSELPENASGRQKVETAIRAHLSAIIDNGDYTLATRRVFGQVPEAIREKNLKLRKGYANLWQDILTDAQARKEFRSDISMTFARLFILGALNWTVEWFKPGGRSIADVARIFSSIIIDGIANPEAEALLDEIETDMIRGPRITAI
jgi:AcrR family transcriptional regulator